MKVLIPALLSVSAAGAMSVFAATSSLAPEQPVSAAPQGVAFHASNVAVPRREGERTDGYVVADIDGLHDESLTAAAATAYVTAALGLLASTNQVQDLDPDVHVHRERLAGRITAALHSMGQADNIRSITVPHMGFIARADGG